MQKVVGGERFICSRQLDSRVSSNRVLPLKTPCTAFVTELSTLLQPPYQFLINTNDMGTRTSTYDGWLPIIRDGESYEGLLKPCLYRFYGMGSHQRGWRLPAIFSD